MENTTPPNPGPNGVSGQSSNGVGANDGQPQATQRAEELVDQWAEQIGQFAATVGHGILRWAALAREEAEDIWAEAQALRRGEKPIDIPKEQVPTAKTQSIWEEAQALRQRQQASHNPLENAPPPKG